ncbi:hypothetical protein GPY51_21575 [Photorhabdus laumondii subsp. laumondii]|uniref:Photorhabdus luminescens subsp. laumondii TTO1 complete genome segment 4/17 n=2 Tax=Photorhabdus laumondii subsp. laumondii TaxID=141679 RepID=Q7N7J5_PHOLL|nr:MULTISPECIES: hypothetical protein [Photorhabdus]AWK41045.1 hypothetical protein A4R40_05700 [Photorhabdus laumondii subsp. laumondii]AXG41786.1 hypothetical protein PluDJC_05490 [Photorhabdus laumondii subsp. laumondii]AXG46374.1 hypothetical protein PluTT01m_05885 [Photorhabdus laumondii subsp. laumondii]KTL63298.1 hypothetical protein AA106_17455 [Photorhabdus laumondii subsp. laumondii]MCC8384913.1 hypothetical protein [Photorhabdus laumondii]
MPAFHPPTDTTTLSVSEMLTPKQRSLIRDLIRDECDYRDRDALLKLLGMITLFKVAGILTLGVLLLVFQLLWG